MKFNYALLEETRKEIKKMKFFKENTVIDSDEYEVIHDFKQAYDNAFRNDFEYEDEDEDDIGYTWVDILEDNMSKVKGIIYQYNNYRELSKIVRDLEIPEVNEIVYVPENEQNQEI